MANDMQKPFLIGEKVYLRPLERDDLKGSYRDWVNDHEVTRTIEAGIFPISDEGLEEFYDKNLNSPNNVLFAIVEKETGKHIGNAQIKNIHWVHRTANRGIMLGDKSAWSKGYAGEVAGLLAAYAFEQLNLNKLKSTTVADNLPIQKLNERLGYVIEGKAREEFFCDGRYHDRVNWALLRSEYLAMKNKTPSRRKKG